MSAFIIILETDENRAPAIIVILLFALPLIGAVVYSFWGTVKEGIGLFREIAIKSGNVHYSSLTIENASKCLMSFPYYQKLSTQGKEEFVKRTLNFLNIKTIAGEDDYEPDYAAKIHVAAAATQLTFGLKDFSFPDFDNVILYPTIFQMSENGPFMKGATTPNGIVRISIKDFDEGYKNSTDKLNVGLHELGHALFMELLKKTGGEIINNEPDLLANVVHPYLEESNRILKTKNDGGGFLRHYAFTNRHEFFAVSVEHFFESPSEFKEKLPVLYQTLTHLLNQDPNNSTRDYVVSENFQRIS
jgi:Mlc titration factor MtfA (ptsG expression regulator)